MTTDEATKVVDDALKVLAEHFDAVIILASCDAPNEDRLTQIIHRGRGNFFAQRGMLREVLERDNQVGIAIELRGLLKKEDEP